MNIPKGMGVFKVTTYEFMRELAAGDPNYPNIEVLRIKVKREISRQDGKFLAIPEKEALGMLLQAKNEYVGEGFSEQEALDACLSTILNVKFSDIFPKKVKD